MYFNIAGISVYLHDPAALPTRKIKLLGPRPGLHALQDGLCSRLDSNPGFPVVLCVALSLYGRKLRKYVTIFLQFQ